MALQPFPLTHVLELRRVPSVTEQFAALKPQLDEADRLQSEIDAAKRGTVSTVTTTVETTDAGTFVTAKAPGLPTPKITGPASGHVVFALPIPPEAVTVLHEPSETLTYTAGATVIESNGLRASTIQVRGSFGVRYLLGTDRNGAPKYWDARRLFVELRQFLADVWKKTSANDGNAYELIWRDFPNGLHYKVLATFQWMFDPERNRIHPRWELPLRVYGTVEPEPSSFIDEHFGWLKQAIQGATDAIDSATLWTEVALRNMEDAINLVGAAAGPIAAIERLLSQIGELANVIRQGKQVAKSLITGVFDAASEAIESIADVADVLGADDKPWAEKTIAAIERAEMQASLSYATQALKTATHTESAYIVRDGDTLGGIALTVYGDERHAASIATANRLQPPYISYVRLPGTVAPGDRLVLQGPTPIMGKTRDTFPTSAAPTPEEALYGVDFYRSDADDEWEVSATGDDVRLTDAARPVEQALTARMRTTVGSNRAFPAIGLPASVGDPGFAGATALMLAYAREQAEADDRVDGVSSPEGIELGTLVSLKLTVRLRGESNASVPLEVAANIGGA